MQNSAFHLRSKDVENLRNAGINPYPERFETTYANLGQIPEEEGVELAVAGRVTAVRNLGKLTFVVLQDVTGSIQVAVAAGNLCGETQKLFKRICRVGDYLGIRGETFRSRTGQFTVNARNLWFLGLSFRGLPEKWHGLVDVECRYRQRYLDMIANERSRSVILARSRMISAMRRVFEANGFYEVETPVLCNTQSGAMAKPFKTFHNALGTEMYLRIAPEMHLKRAIGAGFNRVFEFAKCFRNEGISREHLQEFTMLEYYCAYWNFVDNMRFTKSLLQESLRETFGKLVFSYRLNGTAVDLDFDGEWPVVTFRDVILDGCGIDIHRERDAGALLAACAEKGVALETEDVESGNFGRIIDALYKKVARPKMIQPTFLTGHPVETSPLARRNDDDEKTADRFHLVVCGSELVNAYSELVDPVDQRKRLQAQAAFRQSGDAEAMEMDEDFLLCVEHGLPPISGVGIGIARLLMTVMDLSNVKEAVLFPLLREK